MVFIINKHNVGGLKKKYLTDSQGRYLYKNLEKTEYIYGALYNWYVQEGTGENSLTSSDDWVTPSSYDYLDLYYYIDSVYDLMNNVVGGELKETGFNYWNEPNTGATNSLNFNGRGSGMRDETNGDFVSIKEWCFLWNSDDDTSGNNGLSSSLRHDNARFSTSNVDGGSYVASRKDRGCSIRLVKHNTTLSHGETGIYVGNDGKRYKTICIDNKEWLAYNLAETKYRNGDLINVVTDSQEWSGLSTPAMCYYNNDVSYAYTTSIKPFYFYKLIGSDFKFSFTVDTIITSGTTGFMEFEPYRTETTNPKIGNMYLDVGDGREPIIPEYPDDTWYGGIWWDEDYEEHGQYIITLGSDGSEFPNYLWFMMIDGITVIDEVFDLTPFTTLIYLYLKNSNSKFIDLPKTVYNIGEGEDGSAWDRVDWNFLNMNELLEIDLTDVVLPVSSETDHRLYIIDSPKFMTIKKPNEPINYYFLIIRNTAIQEINLSTITVTDGGVIDFSDNNNLTDITINTSGGVLLFFNNNPNLSYYDVTQHSELTNISGSASWNRRTWRFQDNGWDAATVNQVLIDFDSISVSGYNHREIRVHGTNSPPDSSSGGVDGLAAKTSLEAKGFLVTVSE